MKKKCYAKEIEYVVPKLTCSMCGKHIKVGEELCTVVLEWGDGRTTCKKCYDEYEIDWSMHDHEDIEYDILDDGYYHR